jgi:hypothetical protein
MTNRSVVQYIEEGELWNKFKDNSSGVKGKFKNYLHDKGLYKDEKREVLERRRNHLEWKQRKQYQAKKRYEEYDGPKGMGVVPGDHSTYKKREINI